MARGRFHLTFPEAMIDQPVIHSLVTDFGLVPNIRRANIEERSAWVIVDLEGADDAIARAVSWLASQGVHVDRIEGE